MSATKTDKRTPDLDPILPTPSSITIDGMPAVVRRLKSREFLALMRVLTRGIGPGIRDLHWNADDADELQGQMVALFAMALPEATDEFIDFARIVVEAKNRTDEVALKTYMTNPDLDVLIDVLTVIAEQEKDDLRALVGKARAALTKIQGLYN